MSSNSSPGSASASPLDGGLKSVLESQSCYETPSGLAKRKSVINNLDILVKQWIQSVSLSRGMHYTNLDRLGGRVVTYGSYMLGIAHEGADIDALCVAPSHITRQEYFTSFYSLLSYQREVRELRAIEDSFCPVLKMKYNGMEVDMTFARITTRKRLPEDLGEIDDDSELPEMDVKCVRSLNGYRGTQMILSLVPDREIFQTTLRAVKLWAKSKGLYGNILGYLGGFSWALLVAKACIDNPKERSAANMLRKYFNVFSEWDWTQPVALVDYRRPNPLTNSPAHTQQQHNNVNNSYNLYAASWNPENHLQEGHHVMKVITPTYPFQNSTFNVTPTTLSIIVDKLRKTRHDIELIFKENRRRRGGETLAWEGIFLNLHLFHEYQHFVIVIASANTKNPIKWFGLIESKIRYFVGDLEADKESHGQGPNQEPRSVCISRIWPKPFTKVVDNGPYPAKMNQLWFIGLDIMQRDFFHNSPAEFNHYMRNHVEGVLKNFQTSLKGYATKFFNDDMDFTAHYVQKADLMRQLSERDIMEIVGCQLQTKTRARDDLEVILKEDRRRRGGESRSWVTSSAKTPSSSASPVFDDIPGPFGDNGTPGANFKSLPSPSSSHTPKRSVSLSSDKFPPPALVQARLNHQGQRFPFSPMLSPNPISPSTPFFDYSVPPPPSPGSLHANGGRNANKSGVKGRQPPSPLNLGAAANSSNLTYSEAASTRHNYASAAATATPNKSSRLSSTSEIPDLVTPLPITRLQLPHFQFNLR